MKILIVSLAFAAFFFSASAQAFYPCTVTQVAHIATLCHAGNSAFKSCTANADGTSDGRCTNGMPVSGNGQAPAPKAKGKTLPQTR